MSNAIQAVRGMNDILPEEADRWEGLEDALRSWLRGYGYRNIRTPILEQTGLFRRAIGEATDIVEREMYSFVDELNGEQLTLRPEATASTVRAAVQHSLLYNGPQRYYYFGPMFRHERPQKGRFRQFHQVGAEALGFPGPDVDAEMLLMCARLWNDLGLEGLRLELNSLGSAEERAIYRGVLVDYLKAREGELDQDSLRRMHTNPLRVLDSKNAAMAGVIAGAPRMLEYLGAASLAHFEGVQRILKDSGIAYRINPRLVRGLDYYNLTVFEWVTDKLGAQGTVCAGGRYDGLFEQIGGKRRIGSSGVFLQDAAGRIAHGLAVAHACRGLQILVQRRGFQGLRTLVPPPSVPGRIRKQHQSDRAEHETAVLLPPRLQLGQLFLFFKIVCSHQTSLSSE